MALSHLPKDALPREKLLARGAGALSDAELLALLLRTGTAGKNVLVMAQEVLDACGGIAGLLHADGDALRAIKGLGGPAKRAELLAVMELARRALAEQLRERPAMTEPRLVADYLQLQLAHRPQECFGVLFLDSQHQLLRFEVLFTGTLDQASVYPREVAVKALQYGAASVVLAHNHPSGQPEPSRADLALTTQLQRALALLDVRVLDHVIVAPGKAVSLAERGALAP